MSIYGQLFYCNVCTSLFHSAVRCITLKNETSAKHLQKGSLKETRLYSGKHDKIKKI